MPADEEFDPASELRECLRQLALAGEREKIEFLIEKQKHNSLTDGEKQQLRELARRSGLNRDSERGNKPENPG